MSRQISGTPKAVRADYTSLNLKILNRSNQSLVYPKTKVTLTVLTKTRFDQKFDGCSRTLCNLVQLEALNGMENQWSRHFSFVQRNPKITFLPKVLFRVYLGHF